MIDPIPHHFGALASSGAWPSLRDGPETAANISLRVHRARALAPRLEPAHLREPTALEVRGGLPLPFRDGALSSPARASRVPRRPARISLGDREGPASRGAVDVPVPKSLHVDTVAVALTAPVRLRASLGNLRGTRRARQEAA